jgi:protein phosphatase
MVRETNQDYFYADEENHLYIVADGMGGHNAGDLASRLSVKTIVTHFDPQFLTQNIEIYKQHLLDLVRQANETVYKTSLENPDFSGMGTTLVMVAIHGKQGVILNVGDSRVYHIRKGVIEQITTDHTLVQALYENGDISLEETYNHPQKNVITRAVGTDLTTLVDSCVVNLIEGDQLMLCSDGLTNYLGDEEIAAKSQLDLRTAVEACVDLALKRGGKDNITALFIEFSQEKECQA